jgi:hypothetical protein
MATLMRQGFDGIRAAAGLGPSPKTQDASAAGTVGKINSAEQLICATLATQVTSN